MSLSKYYQEGLRTRHVHAQNDFDVESFESLISEINQVSEYEQPESTTHNYTNSSVSCDDCSKRIRIEKVTELTKGLHIEMPGSKKSEKYVEAKRERRNVYTHHAIISNIFARNEKTHVVEVELIHMANCENKLQLCKERRTFDLKYDELFIIYYLFPRYSPTQIVERARHAHESNTTFANYHVVKKNCEHFATWCIVGVEENYDNMNWIGKRLVQLERFGHSKQVMYMKSKIEEALRYIFGHGSKVAEVIRKLLYESSDEISKILRDKIPDWLPSPESVLYGTSGLYTIYCLCVTVYMYIRRWKGTICESCFNGQLSDHWAKFGVNGGTSIATYFMTNGVVSFPVVISTIGVIALSIYCQYKIPSIRKVLMAPYCCTKKRIRRLQELEVGDIVTLYYFGLPHDVLITEIHQEDINGKKGKLRAVHYAADGLLSTRIVKEEYFTVNLNYRWVLGWSVKRHECEHLAQFPPRMAVGRARKRVGETKWDPVTNRSDHVCYWAKIRRHTIRQDTSALTEVVHGATKSSLLSSLLIGESEVHLSADIEIGDFVRYHEKEGIVVEKSGSEREMTLELALVEGTVKFRFFSISLNTENIQVFAYHPVHCYEKPIRAERARHLIGQFISKKVFKDFCILFDG